MHQTIIESKLFKRGERVAIAASGGKDSTVLAHVMTTLNERHGCVPGQSWKAQQAGQLALYQEGGQQCSRHGLAHHKGIGGAQGGAQSRVWVLRPLAAGRTGGSCEPHSVCHETIGSTVLQHYTGAASCKGSPRCGACGTLTCSCTGLLRTGSVWGAVLEGHAGGTIRPREGKAAVQPWEEGFAQGGAQWGAAALAAGRAGGPCGLV